MSSSLDAPEQSPKPDTFELRELNEPVDSGRHRAARAAFFVLLGCRRCLGQCAG